MRDWRGRIRAALLAGTTIAVGLSIVALAAGDRPRETASTQTPDPNVRTAIGAKCPRGLKPVSGGFEVKAEGDQGDLFPFFVNQSDGLTESGKGWKYVTVNLLSPGSFTAIAYCSRLGDGVVVRTARKRISPGSGGQATATCKRNERVLSGGYAFVTGVDDFGAAIASFRDGGRSWSVRGINFDDSTNDITLVTTANCLPRGKAPAISVEKQTRQVNGSERFSPKCGGKRNVIAGGYKPASASDRVVQFKSRRGSRESWKQIVQVVQADQTAKVTAFAYCVDK